MEKLISNFTNLLRERNNGKIAYKYIQDEKIVEKTYDTMCNNMDSTKNYLLKNYGERNKIAIISESSYNWITLCIGIYTSNNILVSIDYNLSAADIKDMLEFVETKLVFISRSQYEKFEEELKKLKVDVKIIEEEVEPIYSFKEKLNCEIKSEDLGHLLFTSGTTSKKKGIMLSYNNIEKEIYNDELKYNDDLMLSLLPMYHCFELFCGNLFRLYRGSTICLNDNINNLVKNMQIFRPKFITIVPEIANKFNELIKQLGIDTFNKMTGGQLKTISLGGAATNKDVLTNLENNGMVTYEGYGLTETTSCCITTNINNNVYGTVGKPIRNDIEIKTINNELLIKGPTVMMGYYKNEEETNKVLKNGWFYTGDLAEINSDGNVKILGRKLNKIVLSNGKNIYPEELEAIFNDINNVNNSLVYEMEDKINLLLSINENANKDIILKQIEEINKKMPGYKQICKIDFTNKQFPMTTTKKIRRQILLDKLDEYLNLKITKEELYNKVKNIIKNKNYFSYNDNIFDYGFDSISAMELSCILNISPKDIYDNKTVNELFKFINNEKTKEITKENINRYININKNLTKPFKEDTILLTGATGFLGSHILNEICDKYKKIYCLVRNTSKIKTIYDIYFNERIPENVELIVGDITKPMFGLSENIYFKYLREINSIIHCAANVSHIANYEEMHKTNVLGTKNIIKFARQSNSILHYMSTYSVSGYGLTNIDKKEIFDESVLDIGQDYESNIYVKTKYEAECEILKARYEGLLVNIYRIGSLSWRNDGMFQINKNDNGIIKRFNGFVKSNVIINNYKNIKFDLTPVDECANAITKLINDEKINNIYHLYNNNLISLETFINKDTEVLSKEEIKNRIQEEKDEDIKVYYYYSILSDNKNLELLSEKTNKKLKKLGFKWNKIDENYILKFK